MSSSSRTMARVTCSVHHRISSRITNRLTALHSGVVFVDSARSVRRINRRRKFGFPGIRARLDDAPTDQLQFTVEPEYAYHLMNELIEVGELDLPGHGSVYVQEVTTHGQLPMRTATADAVPLPSVEREMRRDLMRISCVLSMPDSARTISSIALDLGTSVPIVTFGTGTGLRNKLGLLRITVPAQKEIVHLVVPRHDTEGIIRLLIEGGRLNLPGRGFLYYTPISAGFLDTGLRIGPQDHAASMEQMIAAIDEIKGNTAWRRRFPRQASDKHTGSVSVVRDNVEISVRCPEGQSTTLIEAALKAGAKGATTSRSRRMRDNQDDGLSTAWELTNITVPRLISETVINTIAAEAAEQPEQSVQIESMPCPAGFSN